MDKSGDSPFGAKAHRHLCEGLERELTARGFHLEKKPGAGWRIQCFWREVEWRKVNQMARVPMSRTWYLGAVYDPQGEIYSLEGKNGKYRARHGVLRVAGWLASTPQGADPDWSVDWSQSGGSVSRESLARVGAAVADALEHR